MDGERNGKNKRYGKPWRKEDDIGSGTLERNTDRDGETAPWNLQVLCYKCNAEKSAKIEQ